MKLFFVSLLIALLLVPLYYNITTKIHKRFNKKILIYILTFVILIASFLPLGLLIIIFSLLAGNILKKVPLLISNVEKVYYLVIEIINKYNASILPDFNIQNYIQDVQLILKIVFVSLKSVSEHLGSISLYMILIVLFLELFLTTPYSIYKRSPTIINKENKDILLAVVRLQKEFMQGLVIVRLILFVTISFILWLLDVPDFWFWSLLATVLSVVPYLGLIGVGSLCAVYSSLLAVSLDKFLILIAIFTGFHLLEANVLTPIIVGKKIKLNALSIFVALVVGLMLWGIIGMFLSLPVLATIRILGKYYKEIRPIAILVGDD